MPKRPLHQISGRGAAPMPMLPAERLQALLELTATIATSLRAATDRASMETALEPILTLTVDEQVALMGALGRERTEDALIVATAFEEFGHERISTKEARRSIARLRSQAIHTHFSVPHPSSAQTVSQSLAASFEFAGGWASQTRETSEVVLALRWSRTTPPFDAEGFVLDLHFWHGETMLRNHVESIAARRFEKEILDPIRTSESFSWVSVTAGQARWLIENAIEQRDWLAQNPADAEWSAIEPVLLQRLQCDETPADSSIEAKLLPSDMDEQETLLNFWGSWSFGDFELAYDLLSERHAILERESREEFIELRRKWFKEASPKRFQMGTVAEQTQEQSGIWLPSTGSVSMDNRKNLKFFWSLELQESSFVAQMLEMPMATLVHPDTSRHWFWQSITMERDSNSRSWRVGRIKDEGASAQALSVEQLLKRHEDLWQQADTASQAISEAQMAQEELQREALRVMSLAQESLSNGECALMRLPSDRVLHDQLFKECLQISLYERASAMLHRTLLHFPNDTSRVQRDLTGADYGMARQQASAGNEDAYHYWLDLALRDARASLESHRDEETLAMLAEMLMASGQTDESEALLRESLAISEKATTLLDLGDLLMQREDHIAAVEAFERAAQLEPENPQVRWRLGRALMMVDRPAEARLAFEDAISRDDNDAMAHALLGSLLFEQEDWQDAWNHLYRAVQLGLVTAPILIQMANITTRGGQFDVARSLLTQAMRVDPSIAADVRRMLNDVQQFEAQEKRSKKR
jgi:tetratricopeptide (TPR) repeat protein